jgi:hypothetical protein
MLRRCGSQRIVSIVVAYRIVLFNPFRERFQGFAKLFLRADVLDGSFQCGFVVRRARCDFLWRQGLQLSLNAVEEVLRGACGQRKFVVALETSTYHRFAKRASQDGIDVLIHVLVVDSLSFLEVRIQDGQIQFRDIIDEGVHVF